MIIYIDSNYLCHINNDGTLEQFETELFDNMPDEIIKGYRYIPFGRSWFREDGQEFIGECMFPAGDYKNLVTNLALSYLNDDQAETVTMLYNLWKPNVSYSIGDRRQYNGLLYRCVQNHTSQIDWTPDITPALWTRTWTEEFPEWVQPTGAQDAYSIGDKVSHNGKHWISLYNANIWEPGVFGWENINDI